MSKMLRKNYCRREGREGRGRNLSKPEETSVWLAEMWQAKLQQRHLICSKIKPRS